MKSLLQVSMLLAMGGVVAAFHAPQLPPPFQTEAVNNVPVVIAQPEGVQLKLPPGFKIQAAAGTRAAPPSPGSTPTALATRSWPRGCATSSDCASCPGRTPCGPPPRSATAWATTSSPTITPR